MLIVATQVLDIIKRDDNDKAIVSAFTIILGISTIGLWIATFQLQRTTDKLWEAGERQLEFTSNNAISQAEATRQSISAAITSNQISVTNSEQQLRAYITAAQIKIGIHRHPERIGTYGGSVAGEIHTYEFAAILKNGGQTPATNVVVNASCRVIPNNIALNFDFQDSELFGYGLIDPQGELFTPPIWLSRIDFETIGETGEWYFWGWVEYDDIFTGTIRHRTEFCFQAKRRLGAVGFIPYYRFNVCESDCLRPVDPHTNKST